jgi:general secretion pathway protein I
MGTEVSPRARGFTLVEVLLALAIVSLLLGSLGRVAAGTIESVEFLRTRQLAEWVAEDRVAILRATRAFPPVGAQEGRTTQGGRVFYWREEVSQTPNERFRRVDVSVFDQPTLSYVNGQRSALLMRSGL